MRRLNSYMNFDFAAFQAGKEFTVQNVRWNENKECVTLSVIITKDESGDSRDRVPVGHEVSVARISYRLWN